MPLAHGALQCHRNSTSQVAIIDEWIDGELGNVLPWDTLSLWNSVYTQQILMLDRDIGQSGRAHYNPVEVAFSHLVLHQAHVRVHVLEKSGLKILP